MLAHFADGITWVMGCPAGRFGRRHGWDVGRFCIWHNIGYGISPHAGLAEGMDRMSAGFADGTTWVIGFLCVPVWQKAWTGCQQISQMA